MEGLFGLFPYRQAGKAAQKSLLIPAPKGGGDRSPITNLIILNLPPQLVLTL